MAMSPAPTIIVAPILFYSEHTDYYITPLLCILLQTPLSAYLVHFVSEP